MALPLRRAIEQFVSFKRRLGCAYAIMHTRLRSLDRWLAERGVRSPADVTPALLQEWVQLRSRQVARFTLVRDLSFLRLLYRFLHSRGVVPRDPTRALPRVRPPQYVPFVFTVDQVRSLLSSGPKAFRKPETRTMYYTLFHLLYATGMRISEALHLRIDDVDLDRRILRVRKTKFHKTRLVPLGQKASRNVRVYLELRRRRTPCLEGGVPVFESALRRRGSGPLSPTSARRALHAMLRRIGLERPRQERGIVWGQARIHSLRHSFAVHRLLKWYRDGVDVNQKLLLLSTYMGHSHVAHTQVYLALSDVVLVDAQKRVVTFLARAGRP